jgi:hypothetical protein
MMNFPKIPDRDAGALITALKLEQMRLEHNLPADSGIFATAVLANGQAIQIISAYAREHDIIVIHGLCEGQSCVVVTHQSSLQCILSVEKLEPERKRMKLGFYLNPPAEEAES